MTALPYLAVDEPFWGGKSKAKDNADFSSFFLIFSSTRVSLYCDQFFLQKAQHVLSFTH